MTSHIGRRKFLATLGGAAVACPLAARAQQITKPVVGFLNSASAEKYAYLAAAFRQGLSDLGFVDGQNITIEYRWAAGQYDRLSEMAADLVRREAAVIVVNTPAVMPTKKATSTIPIVFFTAADPVEAGFVASLSRPGGNLTGISSLYAEIGPKRLELLHELVPKATTIGLLVNPNNAAVTEKLTRDIEAGARSLGLEIRVLRASTERDLNGVFVRLADAPGTPLLIGADAFLVSQSETLARLCLQHAVPAIFEIREFAAGDGLMSYGSSARDSFRQVGIYAGRILRGEKPADLPVQQPTKVELVINLKTAKALGITVPPTLIARADEVIE
jgi:putative tryptophan/tyrosine transport system substrate-binding protein